MSDNEYPVDFLNRLQELEELEKQAKTPEGIADLTRQLESLNFYGLAATQGIADPALENPLTQYIRNEDYASIEAMLGPEAANKIREGVGKGYDQLHQDVSTDRSTLGAVGDTAQGVGRSLIMGSLGFASVGAAGVDAITGTNLADRTSRLSEQINKFSLSGETEALRGRRRAAEARNRYLFDENERRALQKTEAAGGGLTNDLGAWASRVGHDALTSIQTLTSDPILLGAGVTDAITSLASSLLGSHALAKLGTSVLSRVTGRAITRHMARGMSKEAAEALALKQLAPLAKNIDRVSWATSVGGQEGASAFQEAYAGVLNQSIKDLQERSEPFRQRVAELTAENPARSLEDIQEQARRELARLVAFGTAAGTALGAATLAGTINFGVGKALKGGAPGILASGLSEATEEGLIGIISASTQNALRKRYVDSDQTMAEGVGQQLGEGGLLGGITGGMAGVPTTLSRAPRAAASGLNLLGNIREQRASNQSIQELIQRVDALPQVTPEDASSSPELAQLANASKITEPVPSAGLLTSEHQAKIGDNRIKAITEIAKALNQEKDPLQQQALALVLQELMEPLTGTLKNTPATENQTAQQYRETLSEVSRQNEVNRALQRAEKIFTEQLQDVTPETVATPEGQRASNTILAHLTKNPSTVGNIKTSTLETILQNQGDKLNPTQRAALQGALALTKARDSNPNKELMTHHTQQVGDNVISDGATSLESGKYSARQHTDRIIRAMAEGNIELAKEHLKDFGLFVQHMDNKVNALNQHWDDDTQSGVSYDQLLPDRTWRNSKSNPNSKFKHAFINKGSARSIALARAIGDEAQLLTDIFNNLAAAYPDLGIQPFQNRQLNPAIRQDTPQSLVQALSQAQRTRKAQAQAASARTTKASAKPQEKAPVASQKTAPQSAKTNPVRAKITEHFESRTREEQERDYVLDPMTGAYSEAGAKMLPLERKTPYLVIFSLEAKKILNDIHSHGALDGALKIMASIIADYSDTPMKIGGDVQGYFSSIAEAQKAAKAMEEALGWGQVTIGYSNRAEFYGFDAALKAANENLNKTTDKLRADNKLAKRKSPPVQFLDANIPSDINWDYDAKEGKTDGVDWSSSPEVKIWLEEFKTKTKNLGELLAAVPTEQLIDNLHPSVQEQVGKISPEQLLENTYYEPKTGLLTQAGFLVASRGMKFFSSLDLRSLKLMNNLLGTAEADKLMEVFGSVLVDKGGRELAAAHLHGDEYALAGMDEAQMLNLINKFETALNTLIFYKEVRDKEGNLKEVLVQDGMSFAWGIGPDLDYADGVDLARRKAEDAASGKRIAEPQRYTGEEAATRLEELRNAPDSFDLGPISERRAAQEEGRRRDGPNPQPAQTYPKLIEVLGKVRNFFKDNFKFKTNSSRLVYKANPLRSVQEALSNATTFEEFTGNKPKRALSREVSHAYRSLLNGRGNERTAGGILKALHKNLNDFLDTKPKNSEKTYRQMLIDGDREFTHTKYGKALNFIEVENGETRYNRSIAAQATMAAIQWALVSAQNTGRVDSEAIHESLGLEDETLPDDILERLSQGSTVADAKTTLADTLQRFMGVEHNTEAPHGHARAVLEGFAAELIKAMEASGFITRDNVDVSQYVGEGRQFTRLIPHKWNTDNKVHPLNRYPELLEEAVVVEPEQHVFYGDVKIPVSQTMRHNRRVKLTKKTKQAIKNMQDQAYFLNLPFADIINGLDFDHLAKLLGEDLPRDENQRKALYNAEDLKSRESRNMLLEGAFEEFRNILAQMKDVAEAEGISLGQVIKKYKVAAISNNRFMLLGSHNPQASKLMRELIMPTWHTMDLVNNQDHINGFMQAMAQALGIKVHQKSLETNIREAQALLEGDLAPAIGVLSSWLQGRDSESVLSGKAIDRPFPVDDFRAALDPTGIPSTPLTIMALVEWTRFNQASDSEKAAFKTPIYLESDGMTNGPFNSIGILSTDFIRPEDIDNMRRGGLHLGEEAKTSDQTFAMVGQKDLYQAGVDTAQTLITKKLKALTKEGQKLGKAGRVLLSVMSDLLGKDVNWIASEDRIELLRGIGKNPMTTLIYGAGVQSQSKKMAHQLATELYSKLTEVTRGLNEKKTRKEIAQIFFPGDPAAVEKTSDLINRIAEMASNKVIYSRKAKKHYIFPEGNYNDIKKRLENDPASFKFTKGEMDNIAQTISTIFMGPLSQGIKDTLGKGVFESNKTLIKITNIQAKVFDTLFQKAISELRDGKIGEYREEGLSQREAELRVENEFLSDSEIEGIWDSLSDIFPLVGIDNQNLLLAKSGRMSLSVPGSDGRANHNNKALRGDLGSNPELRVLREPGVAAIPALTIGMGDARMVQQIFAEGTLPNAMQVYDGINIPPAMMQEYGERINRAAFNAWGGNIYTSLYANWINFVNHPLVQGHLSEFDSISELTDKLAELARNKDARQRAFNELQVSFDQMAATYSPYVRPGMVIVEGTSSVDIANTLNARIAELKADGTFVLPTPTTLESQQAPTPEPEKPLPNMGRQNKTGVRILGKTAIRGIQKALRETLSDNENQVLGEIFRSGVLSEDLKVVTGSLEQVRAYQEAQGLTSLNEVTDGNPDALVHGFYSPADNTIYVMGGQETLVHELVHAATFNQVLGVLDGSIQDPVAGSAVARLQHMMSLFLEGEFELEGTPAETSYLDAKSQIEAILAQGDSALFQAQALNEFMAWTLANPDLANQLKDKQHPLVRMTKAVFDQLKKLIWGRKKAPEWGEDILSQIRFNTAILVRTAPSLESAVGEISLAHAVLNGTQENPTRASKVMAAFQKRVARHLNHDQNTDVLEKFLKEEKQNTKQLRAEALALDAEGIFNLSSEERDAFAMQVLAMTSGIQLDSHVMIEAQKAYDHFIQNVTQDDFLTGNMDEQNDAYLAHEQYQFLTKQKDRDTLIPIFLALGAVSSDMQNVLNRISPPEGRASPGITSLDGALETIQLKTMDKLESLLTDTTHVGTTGQLVDQLNQKLIKQTEQAKNRLQQALESADQAGFGINAKVAQMLDKVGNRLGETGSTLMQSENKFTKSVGSFLKATSILASETQTEAISESVYAWADKTEGLWEPIRELISDVVGRTESQGRITDMVKQIRKMVSQTRSQFRERVPNVIAKQFKVQPTAQQWDSLYRMAGRYDVASLLDTMGVKQALELMNNAQARAEYMGRLEESIYNDPNYALYQEKMDQYVNFVITGVRGPMLLRNAHAIAEFAGPNRTVASAATIKAIDQLITLKLMDRASETDKKAMAELSTREMDGLNYVFNYLKGLRKGEYEKTLKNDKAKYNYYKGMLPKARKDRGHLVVDALNSGRENMGYVFIGGYENDPTRGYYYSTEGGVKPTFTQGIIQNVQHTAYGVNLDTGFSTDGIANLITNPATVKYLKNRIARNEPGTEHLSPIFDEKGNIWAFEESMDPRHLARLETSQNLALMIGEWKGRQIEEVQAKKANKFVINELKKMYHEDIKLNPSNEERYVNVLESDDPIIRDAVSVLPREFRQSGKLMIRRSLVNTAIGYRNASVGDVWTQNTRWPPELQRITRDALRAILGPQAYRKAVGAEQNWQSVIRSVKTNIVVRSIVVPIANFLSGVYQLRARGVSMRKVMVEVPKKTLELEHYIKAMSQIVELDSHIYAAAGNAFKTGKLEARKAALEDSIRRLSIWPLLQAGEFSTISEVGGQGTVEFDVNPNNIMDKIEKAVDNLPKSLRDFARQGYMSKDTELFKILQKATQYSDFVMKAIYYDQLTQVEKLSTKSALAIVTDEFVNYDLPIGRTRQALEANGLGWFLNYKLRTPRVALSMIRKNPVDLLLYSAMPLPFAAGIPVTDNIFSSILKNTLGYSIGPEMMLNPISINPWYNLVAD